MSINFSVMILAAGFGKRMMPLTKNIPKPLIEINGITLLDNAINFSKKLGSNEIIINSHYKYKKIKQSLKKRSINDNIILIYEKEILDTGGGIKNAIPFFKNENILIINSDIFWQNENLVDVENLINDFKNHSNPSLLLVKKLNAFGLSNKNGDFVLVNNNISRFTKGDAVIYYTGLQILKKDIFKNISKKKFSLNYVWDFLINQKRLYGQIMKSNWYHVGDAEGLRTVRKLNT